MSNKLTDYVRLTFFANRFLKNESFEFIRKIFTEILVVVYFIKKMRVCVQIGTLDTATAAKELLHGPEIDDAM